MTMRKPTTIKPKFAAFVLLFFIIAACTNIKQAPPFPVAENEFKQPITQPFEFTEADTIAWTKMDPDPLKPLPIKKFDWDKLPAKAVDFGLPIPFVAPSEAQAFSLDSLPSMPFHMDSLPSASLSIAVKPLGAPKIIKAGTFSNQQGATRGVMAVTQDLGLPSVSRTVYKDRKGMIWIGMDGKIAKYDSENLWIYGAEQGLQNTAANELFEDSKGRLWVGNRLGAISIIDFEAELVYEVSGALFNTDTYGIIEADDGKFWLSNVNIGYDIIDLEAKTIHRFTQKEGLLGNFGLSPYQDKAGLIWLSSGGGANIIDVASGKNIQLTVADGLPASFTSNFYEDTTGRFWISNGNGVSILNKERTTLSHLISQDLFEGMTGVTSVIQDASGSFYLGGSNGVMYYLDEAKGLLQRIEISNTPSRALLHLVIDKQGQVWGGIPQGGLFKFDPNTGRPGNFTTEDGLNSNAIWCTLEAQDGTIWIGSYEGIDVYDPKTKTIKHLGTAQGLISNRAPRLKEDAKGRIWITGSTLGMSIIDPGQETIQQLTVDQGLQTNSITGSLDGPKEEIWLGGAEGEIIKADIERANYTYYLPTRAEHIFQNNFLINDLEDHIWIATLGAGIQRINPATNERVFLNSDGGLVSNIVYSLIVDEDNSIWAATDLGVQMIHVPSMEITTFTTAEGLAANDVYAIAKHKGEVFTGTSRGLTILSQEVQADQQKPIWKVKTIGKGQGLNLLDFSENSFTFDRNDNFWAGVQGEMLTVMDGIVIDTTSSPTFITGIHILDQKQQFYDREKVRSKRIALDSSWLPNPEEFDVGDLISKDTSNLAKNDIEWTTTTGAYDMPVGLSLPYTQNYLSFSYSGTYFANADQVYYRYILEGIDKNWSPVSQETVSENYRDLPPGDYSFKVASKGFNDVWGAPSSFDFTILPPWWRTWWASLLFLVIAGAIIWFIMDYRSRWLKKENRVLEERVSHRTVQLKNKIDELKATQSQLIQSEKMASLGELTAGIAHEIQNPLNFVNNFSEVNTELIDEMQEELKKGDYEEVIALSKDIRENQQKINHHGKRADAIVKGMLQHSRSSSSIKEPSNINAIADEYLRLAYHGLRAKDKSFNATLNTDLDEKIGKINIVPQDVGRVILNLITNAFHAVIEKQKKEKDEGNTSYKPTVWVSTKRKGHTVLVSIRDNGNGVPDKVKDKIFQPFFTTKPSGQGTGLGLSLSYDIIQTHGGELLLETKQGEGTTFTISLPDV